MIYLMSDLHGYYDEFLEMLNIINFKDTDTLYILGDIVDRGPKVIDLLLYVISKENIILLKGNHEDLMYLNLVEFEEIDDGWVSENNGGSVTLKQFNQLSEDIKIEILVYLNALDTYKEISLNGLNYYLVHGTYNAIRESFGKESAEYSHMFCKSNIHSKGPNGSVLVFGHVPTSHFQDGYPMRIWKSPNGDKIGLDCGLATNDKKISQLGCIRLNDMVEFYVGIK